MQVEVKKLRFFDQQLGNDTLQNISSCAVKVKLTDDKLNPYRTEPQTEK